MLGCGLSGGSSGSPFPCRDAYAVTNPSQLRTALDSALDAMLYGGTFSAGSPTVASVFQRADVDLDTLVQEIKVVEFEYDKESQERDPTIPLAGDAMRLRAKTMVASVHRTPEDLVQAAKMKSVTGIIWDQATPYAVIDNNVVSKG